MRVAAILIYMSCILALGYEGHKVIQKLLLDVETKFQSFEEE